MIPIYAILNHIRYQIFQSFPLRIEKGDEILIKYPTDPWVYSIKIESMNKDIIVTKRESNIFREYHNIKNLLFCVQMKNRDIKIARDTRKTYLNKKQ